MTLFIAFFSGLVFAVGLVLSGMTEPARILDFLDFAGHWDPSLAFVILGAVGVFAPLYKLTNRNDRPKFAATFQLPTRRNIDGRLLLGAGLFGVGWGLSGLCPGPAVVSAGSLAVPSIVFVVAMLGGMQIFRVLGDGD
ncbi:MAG: YeeE/YedE family protein [Myxococcales bacterium]